MTRGQSERPRLRWLRGGLADAGVTTPQWRAFCARIGWQHPPQSSLPADYEEQLVERIFGGCGRSVVSLPPRLGRSAQRQREPFGEEDVAAELSCLHTPMVHRHAVHHTGMGLARRARMSWWTAVAVAALITMVGAAAQHWGAHPVASQRFPTPSPDDRAIAMPSSAPPFAPGPPSMNHRKVTTTPVAPNDARPSPAPRVDARSIDRPDPGGAQVAPPSVRVARGGGGARRSLTTVDAVGDEGAIADIGGHRQAATSSRALVELNAGWPNDVKEPLEVAALVPGLSAGAFAAGDTTADGVFGWDAADVLRSTVVPLAATPWRARGAWYGVDMAAPREEGTPAGVQVLARVDLAAVGRQLF